MDAACAGCKAGNEIIAAMASLNSVVVADLVEVCITHTTSHTNIKIYGWKRLEISNSERWTQREFPRRLNIKTVRNEQVMCF